MMRSLSVRCDSATIPGRSFATTPYRLYGPARNMPYEQIYSGEINLSMILSSDLRERVFFESWMTVISSNNNYKMSFYDDYTTTVEVCVLNRKDACLFKVNLLETYPKALGEIQVGYDKDNEFMKQDVTISFRKYSWDYYGAGRENANPSNPQNKPRTQLGSLNASLGNGPNRFGPQGEELIEYLESQRGETLRQAAINRDERAWAGDPLEQWFANSYDLFM